MEAERSNGRFKKGAPPWNKGLKGIHLSRASEFPKGNAPWNKGKVLGKQSPELVARRFAARKIFAHSEAAKQKMRDAKHARLNRLGYVNSPETRAKISATLTGRKNPAHSARMRGRKNPRQAAFMRTIRGPNHHSWIPDRSKLKNARKQMYDSAYRDWMRRVKDRDGWKCRIADSSCSGRLEAHHILPWVQFPELRYQIKNGITLCHHHHPRSRAAVMELSPFFQQLVAEAQ